MNFFKFYMAAELGPLGVDQLRVIWWWSSFLCNMAEKSDPFEGLTFSGAPAEYRHFRRKVLLHVASLEEKRARLAGPKIFTRLTGEAWSATEHLSIADLRTEDGWLRVLEALDAHYRYLPEAELNDCADEFLFHVKRKP